MYNLVVTIHFCAVFSLSTFTIHLRYHYDFLLSIAPVKIILFYNFSASKLSFMIFRELCGPRSVRPRRTLNDLAPATLVSELCSSNCVGPAGASSAAVRPSS